MNHLAKKIASTQDVQYYLDHFSFDEMSKISSMGNSIFNISAVPLMLIGSTASQCASVFIHSPIKFIPIVITTGINIAMIWVMFDYHMGANKYYPNNITEQIDILKNYFDSYGISMDDYLNDEKNHGQIKEVFRYLDKCIQIGY